MVSPAERQNRLGAIAAKNPAMIMAEDMRDLGSRFRAKHRPWAIAMNITSRAWPEGTRMAIIRPTKPKAKSVLFKDPPIASIPLRAIRLPSPVRSMTSAMIKPAKTNHGMNVVQGPNAIPGFVMNSV